MRSQCALFYNPYQRQLASPGGDAIEVDIFIWNNIKKYFIQGINFYVPNVETAASAQLEDMQEAPDVTRHLSYAASAS